MKFKFFIVFFIFYYCFLFGKKYDIINLTNNEGLSNSSINVVYQNSNEHLWFGTWDGLNLYNGRDFSFYKPNSVDNQSISNNIIRDIVQEDKNIHWIATDKGINRFDLRTKFFEQFFIDESFQAITNEHSFFIAKNQNNIIFAAIYNQGLFYFSNNEHKFIKFEKINNLKFKKILFDSQNNLWIQYEDKTITKISIKNNLEISAINEFSLLKNIESVFVNNTELWLQTTDDRIFLYNIQTEKLNTIGNLKQISNIRSIAFRGNLHLLGTANGLFQYDTKENKIEEILPKISVLSVIYGSQDIIWVGTDMQGVWQLSISQKSFNNYSTENIPNFGNSAVRTFFEDKNHLLWVGTKGNGIFTFYQKNDYSLSVKSHFTSSNGLLSNSIFTIIDGNVGEYWIGTDGKGINYVNADKNKIYPLLIDESIKNKIKLYSVYSILPMANDILWVGTSGYGMYKLEIDKKTIPYKVKNFKQFIYINDKKTSLSNNTVYSIIKDDDNHLWIATRGGGLNRFNIKKEEFIAYRFSNKNNNSLSSDDILCLHKDKKNYLWAGTSMGLNKLVKFENETPVFIRFTEKDGMPNNTIHGILEDNDENLWLSTNKGIAKLVQTIFDYKIISYFKKDGLQNNEFSDGAFYKSPYSGLFYFGGISGFNIFNYSEITHNTFNPLLLMDAFYLDNVETNIYNYISNTKNKETLVLSHKNKSFSFKFIPLDYLSGNKCEISYLLEGFQKDWVHIGTSSNIVFTNIPKGNYILKVRCSNANKIWNEQYFSLQLKMLPPWWQSNIALIFYFILLISLLLAIDKLIKYRLTIKHELEKKELEKQKIEDIHQAKLSFFTNIAHEFSNSITLIYGPCEQLLKLNSSDTIIRKYINVIKSNSERMQTLIQQLIDFRKAETGHLKLDIEKVDIQELIKFVADNFIDILEQKKIKFKLSFLHSSNIWNIDRDCLEKIVFNLMSNASKYTPENENIIIDVLSENNLLTIKITNTGIGIKSEFQKSIFDRFEVLERFEKQVSKGIETSNGIGLALCKNIVEILNGTIDIDSDGLTFTTFIVKIPEQQRQEHFTYENKIETKETTITKNEKNTIDNVINKSKELILIVDDYQEIRELLIDSLSLKYEVLPASNGVEAIDIVKTKNPSLVVCDIIMPQMDGVQFVKAMKNQMQTRHIPIILLSSKNTIESQIEGLEIGADAYLSKPFHPRHLEALIESLLDRNKAVLDYSESHYAALEQYEGKLIHKEDKELMLKIIRIIYDNIDNESLSIEFIAKETALSKMQLYRKIKEIVDQAPTEYIRSIRLKQVEKLLKTSNKTVQEIMYSCGFNNKTYFYRVFAKKYHLTPKEYRSQIQLLSAKSR